MEEDTKQGLIVNYGLGLLMVALAAYLDYRHAGPWWIAGTALAGLILILHGHFPRAFSVRRIVRGVVVLGVVALLFGAGWFMGQHQQQKKAAHKGVTVWEPQPPPQSPKQPEGKKEPIVPKRPPNRLEPAKKEPANADTPEGRRESGTNTEATRAQPVPPDTVNNCPGGICISGGTVTNPTVVNGPPPAKLRITPSQQNQKNFAAVAVNGRPNPENLYHSIFLIDVKDSAIPGLVVSARGAKLRQLECGQQMGMYPTITAVNGEASCPMNGVFGSGWFFGIQTLSPVGPGDVRIDLVCSGIRCEQ
jgi:hypothetical protein